LALNLEKRTAGKGPGGASLGEEGKGLQTRGARRGIDFTE